MNCFVHQNKTAVGVCSMCGRAVCNECLNSQVLKMEKNLRLICPSCVNQFPMAVQFSKGFAGYEYKSKIHIGSWPLIHIALGVDPQTFRPRIAKGIIAIGGMATGVFCLGGISLGLFTISGVSVGLLTAIGGLALGFGFSFGGLAVGSVAIGGVAIGFKYALGGLALGSKVVGGFRCDPEAARFFSENLDYDRLEGLCAKMKLPQ